MDNRRWLFVCSCVALVTSAFTFVVRGDILQEIGGSFDLTQQQNGSIEGAVFLGMALSMLCGGFICDLLGIKRVMFLALASHLLGSVGTIFAPHSSISFPWLLAASLLMGCGNGFTEVGINPLIATLYSDRKTHYLNILHAWWPGGLVIGGLLARLVGEVLHLNWQCSLCLIVLPAIAYGLMLLPARFPQTERVASGVSTGDMFKECVRPLLLIWAVLMRVLGRSREAINWSDCLFGVWAVCMLLTAATELGPQKWQESVMTSTAHVSGTMILVYTSGMMFVLRHFAGPIAHAISPVGMLTGSAILAGIGLRLLSYADSAPTAFGYATIFGLGIAFFWPTMLGVTAERFPKGGALALALMGSVGNLSISQVLPQMGRIVDVNAVAYAEEHAPATALPKILKQQDDRYIAVDPDRVEKLKEENADSPEIAIAADAQAHGYRMAFRTVSLLPVALVVLFTMIIFYDRSRGGYRPEILLSREEENELLAGGVQAAVE